MAKQNSTIRVAWEAVSGAAGLGALGLVLNLLISNSHDLKTMAVWGGVGAAIGFLGGLANGADKVVSQNDLEDDKQNKAAKQDKKDDGPKMNP